MFSNLQSETLNELFAALSKAQGEMTSAITRNKNPHYGSKYADLEDVRLAYQESLTKYGLCLTQSQTYNEVGKIYLITMLGHSSGQWIKSVLPVVVDTLKADGSKKGNPIHALGAAITYLRRYAISSMLGIATGEKDNDGNEFSKNPNEKEEDHREAKISVSQLNNIVKLLSDDIEAKTALTDYLKKYDINEFKDITTDLYPVIMHTLIVKKEKAKAVTV